MTFRETIEAIEAVARAERNINWVLDTDDIFDISKDNYEAKFGAFVITLPADKPIVTRADINAYSFRLWVVDRLDAAKGNWLEVQSDALDSLANIVLKVANNFQADVQYGECKTFTERFSEDCAGAYMDVVIETPNITTC